MKAVFSILAVISLLFACREKEDILSRKLDGSWIITSLRVSYQTRPDSVLSSDLGKFTFESCQKKESPCTGERLLDSGQKYAIEFQTSSLNTLTLTFLDNIADRTQDWTGSYDIVALGEELILVCEGCVVSTKFGGYKLEIKAKRL
jgi:hypothetical protein